MQAPASRWCCQAPQLGLFVGNWCARTQRRHILTEIVAENCAQEAEGSYIVLLFLRFCFTAYSGMRHSGGLLCVHVHWLLGVVGVCLAIV